MVRTQIQLTEEQSEKLRRLSLEKHESVASIIRKAVNLYLSSGQRDRSDLFRIAETVLGKYESLETDISLKHDRYLEKDLGS